MVAQLIAEEGKLKGLILSLEGRKEWIIGRDPDFAQIILEDAAVSRRQVQCRSTNEGIIIENLSLTNPIYVNGKELKNTLLLHNGDSVKIGNGVYRFYDNGTTV